jgi:glycosyltransferase involved in cell wall biosynthesis
MPAYNAEGLLEGVVRSIPEQCLEPLDALLVIDDGSTDGTADLVRSLSGEYPIIELVSHPENLGYGAAQKTAFDWALENGMDAAVMLHSDGQYPPDLLLEMLGPLQRDEVHVVGGSRILYGDMRDGGMSLSRYWGTIALNGLENMVFGQKLTSYHSGYKAYSRRVLEEIPYHRYSDTFNFDSEMLVGAIRADLGIAEVPIPTIHGRGYSSLKPIPYGLSVLRTILRYLLHRI